MAIPSSVESISGVIQLAVAPVFLLTGIGSILNVLTARVARIIDRSRFVEAELGGETYVTVEAHSNARGELKGLQARMAAANLAIACCTMAALFVCITIAILFIGELSPLKASTLVASLFIAAMAVLIMGLLLFLFEIRIALRAVRVKQALLLRD